MAGKILALVGDITRAETSRAIGLDLNAWKLRKGDPRTPGTTFKGKSDRRREVFALACASLTDLEAATNLLSHEGYSRKLIVYIRATNRLDLLNLSVFSTDSKINKRIVTSGQSVILEFESEKSDIDISVLASLIAQPSTAVPSALRVVVDQPSLVRVLGSGGKYGVGMEAIPQKSDSIPPFDIYLTSDSGMARKKSDELLSKFGDFPEIRSVTAETTLLDSVNSTWISPFGFQADPSHEECHVNFVRELGKVYLDLRTTSGNSFRSEIVNGFSETIIGELHKYRRVQLESMSDDIHSIARQFLIACACSGIPLFMPDTGVLQHFDIDTAVISAYQRLESIELLSNFERQFWSVETRRLSQRVYSLQSSWAELLKINNIPLFSTDSVSILVSTKRPKLLPQIIRQILAQEHTNIEILIGLHGYSKKDVEFLPDFVLEAANVSIHEFDENMTLGGILNQLTLLSSGRFIAKMDDDDWYSRHHIGDLLLARSYSGADLIGCKAEYVYMESTNTTIQRKSNGEVFNAYVTGGTLLISREILVSNGGWNNVRTAEDRLLQQSILRHGGKVYRMHGMNYIMSRGDGIRSHTWNPSDGFFDDQAVQRWPGLGYPGWEK